MHKQRFPYATSLVFIHTSTSSLFVGVCWLIHRSIPNDAGFFASLPQALADSSIKAKVLSLGGLFSVQLVCSNAAYLYSSVVFIQMMKEGNLPLVYLLSACVALEAFHAQRIGVLIGIVFATLITIQGELHFTWSGFSIQGLGQIFEVCRIVLQAVVLTSNGLSLDVLTYLLFVMPACAVTLAGILAFDAFVLNIGIVCPTFDVILAWWPQLMGSALLAVGLNFSTALVVKHASAVGLVLSGIVKDTAIVVCGAYFLGESITNVQIIGFLLQISGILVYSLMKVYPAMFKDGIIRGLKRSAGLEVNPSTSASLSLESSMKQARYESDRKSVV